MRQTLSSKENRYELSVARALSVSSHLIPASDFVDAGGSN